MREEPTQFIEVEGELQISWDWVSWVQEQREQEIVSFAILEAKYDALVEAARALHSELMRVQSILMEGDIVRLANNLGEVLPTLPTTPIEEK